MKTPLPNTIRRIFFVGIGGISMSALAELLHNRGLTVAGSDLHASEVTQRLAASGISVFIGHDENHIDNSWDAIAYTAAIPDHNPELKKASALGLPLLERAELLGRIMADYPHSIAIAGTHGKTTTTSMTAEILLAADLDPTITVGGILPTIGSNLKVGHSPFFLAEACEYCDSFLSLSPQVGVVLNIEADHLDYFKDIDTIYRSFAAFSQRVPASGTLVLNYAIPDRARLIESLDCKVETFSVTDPAADWAAADIRHEESGKNSFQLLHYGEPLGTIHLYIPGEHNIANALAACAAAGVFGVSFSSMQAGLAHFRGTDRRFQYKGVKDGITVVDDYAHHPTEIQVTLEAAVTLQPKRIICVFQPHTYSRTYTLFSEFAASFAKADQIIIADIYAAREQDTGLVSAEDLANAIQKRGQDAHYVGDFNAVVAYLTKHCQEGDLLLTVGAGDVNRIGEAFLDTSNA